MKRRVVITGMGAVTPVGTGIEAFGKALREGKSGIGPLTRFGDGLDAARLAAEPVPQNRYPRTGTAEPVRRNRYSRTGSLEPVPEAYEVKDFTPLQGTRLLDPFIQYALAAAKEAAETARFDSKAVDPYRIGIVVSSSKGGVHSFHELVPRFLARPSAILGARVYTNLVPNFAAQWIARKWKIQGPAKCYVTACSTGTTSMIEGMRMVEEGVVDYAFAGASDASIVPLMVAAYEKMRVLSPDGMHPFDRRRKGFLLGEGAGVVFLETFESARARGAKIYAEIIGFSYGMDTSHPITFDPGEEALARSLKTLLRTASISVDQIDYVNLHGTGTRAGDLYETEQIKKAFGAKAYSLAMSSTKSMVGHMLGASGAVEAIACSLAMEGGFLPPTVHFEKEDPRCDLDYTPNRAREKKVSTAISISMGFGGHIANLALRKV